MGDFLLYAPKIRSAEGFFSWDDDDSGKLTIWGLITTSDKSWKGWDIVIPFLNGMPPMTNLYEYFGGRKNAVEAKQKANYYRKDLENRLTPYKENLWQLAIPYYKIKYWDKVDGDKLQPQAYAEQIVDTCVNQGLSVALNILKQTNNV